MATVGMPPNSSAFAYAAGADMVAAFDWRKLADLIVDPTTRTGNVAPPNDAATTQSYFTTIDLTGYRALRWASGEIEKAATKGQRYDPADLLYLTQQQVIPVAQGGNGTTTAYMVGRDTLVNLTCCLAFWWLVKRRNPGAKISDFDCVAEAYRALDQLEKGERVFPFAETQAAGLPEEVAADAYTDVVRAAEPLSVAAGRLFGHRHGRG